VLTELGRSPRAELASVLNALDGGFTAPSSGGDPIVNPAALPTGRNMYSVDAERTPSDEAWKVGKRLAESLLEEEYALKGRYPKKISFTLWSTNFISTEGATIAQILYLLGVEPVRDGFGSVRNLKLIPMEELGRPRIDVVIQTSGQLRDLAASRLDLINRAIAMAAEARDADSLNYVKHGLLTSEKYLLEQGFSPLDARTFASKRIFGGVNGNYGTGIMALVEKGDAWEDEEEIARQYLNNMGAIYEKGENWGMFREGIFQAALQETEAVVQPRSSNTWGPLSLDHVYEFMGGMNLTVRHVTGNDPTAYFNDFRNTSRPKMQELKKAIGVETNSTVFNPKYISELLDGEASSMEEFAETFRNTYGWNVMKPSAIDEHVWDNYFDIYVEDKYDLGVRERFEDENPYALQEMSSIMLETARKGYWEASESQLAALAELHAELVSEHEAGCSGFVCDNALLRKFIAQRLPAQQSESYQQAIERERNASIQENQEQVVLEKVEDQKMQDNKVSSENQRRLSIWVVAAVIMLFILFFLIRRRRQ
jgi:cobaltochelatase CobN